MANLPESLMPAADDAAKPTRSAKRTERKQRARSAPVSIPERSPTVEELNQDDIRGIVGYALRRAQTFVYQDYARSVADFDIRPAQFAALGLVVNNPGLSQGTLAQAMGIDRSGAVVLLDALEDKGLAVRVRSPSDRRSYAIMPTKAGENVLDQMRARVAEHNERIAARLSTEERDTLIDLLRRIYE